MLTLLSLSEGTWFHARSELICSCRRLRFVVGAHKLTVEFLEDDEELSEIIGNAKLNENYLSLGRELNIVEAKTPEDIYKSHLAESQGRGKRTLNY